MEISDLLAIVDTVWARVVVPVVAFVAAFFGGWRVGRRKRRALIQFLRGLPPEMKAVLAEFYVDGTHTLTGNPFDPPIAELIRSGVIAKGAGAGGYDAVNRYLAVRPEIWDAMDEWRRKDPAFTGAVMRMLEKAAHDEGGE